VADDDIRGFLGSVQDYLVRGGLDEDARYVLGPHAYEGLSKFASLANFLGPGADVKDIASESAGVMEGDPAAFVGLPAALAMMALPGSKSGVSSSIKDVVDFSSARRAKAIPDDIKYKAAVEDQQPLQTKGEIDSYTGEQLTRNIHDIAKEITLRVLSRPSGTPTPDEQKLMGLVLEQMDLAPKTFGPNSKQVLERMDELSKQILDLDETARGVDDAVDSGLSSIRWYRGTNDPSELSVLRKNKEGTLGGGGVYLTPDPEYASRYAEETVEGTSKKGGFVLPLTARFEKPLIVDLDKTRGYMAESRVLEELGLSSEKANAVAEKALEEYGSLTTQASKLAKKQGYDGIILRRDGKIVEALSYRPEDIKSAFGTSTRAEEESMMNAINDIVFEPEPDIQFKNTGGLVTRNPYNRQPKAI
jgi:hypothetical protein